MSLHKAAVSQSSFTDHAPPEERLDEYALQSWLLTKVSELSGVAEAEIQIDQPFTYYGLGSAEAVIMLNALETLLQRTLSPTIAWDYPTIERAARFLATLPAEAQDAVEQ